MLFLWHPAAQSIKWEKKSYAAAAAHITDQMSDIIDYILDSLIRKKKA